MIIGNYRCIKYIGTLFEAGLDDRRIPFMIFNDNVSLSFLIGKNLFNYGRVHTNMDPLMRLHINISSLEIKEK